MHVRAALVVVLVGCGNVSSASDAAVSDGTPSPCAPATCLLTEDFDGASLDLQAWNAVVNGGGTVLQHNGLLSIHLPAAANAAVDVATRIDFPVNATFEAKVTISGGQFFDHKALGFANRAVNEGCSSGETEAAMFRGQDGDSYVETKAGNVPNCVPRQTAYTAGTSTLQITRTADQVVFRVDGVALEPIKSNVPTGRLPVRFSAYTFTQAPAEPIQIDIESVKVTQP